jgi:hypothetical protein
LRKSSLDESPQFFMWVRKSLQAPRLGIAGLLQVTSRSSTSCQTRISCDAYYAPMWSLLPDSRIIIITVHPVLFGKNAYFGRQREAPIVSAVRPLKNMTRRNRRVIAARYMVTIACPNRVCQRAARDLLGKRLDDRRDMPLRRMGCWQWRMLARLVQPWRASECC